MFSFLLCIPMCSSQKDKKNIVTISPDDTMEEIVHKAANVVPSPRQLAWQELELTAFACFSMNTFTDKEWGDGNEDPGLFNPIEFDAGQWAKICRDAGMRMIILTTKHHDGFCLWPSKFTEHSVKNSSWKNGKGDVVGEVAEACREHGLRFGVYLSPWDKHEASYGDTPKYNEFFKNQLRELLTNYGEIAEVWFDGACGEGPNGKRQAYDWQGYYGVIRELQPDAVIAIMGPDVRWVGTESGYGRETEWSVIPVEFQEQDKIAEESQHKPVEKAFVPKDMTLKDFGSRSKIKKAQALAWYPSEVDVSIRPGWFYHQSQDDKVKSPEKLLDIYFSSVGRNSLLLLNIPPDRRGLIHENDIKALQGWRTILDSLFSVNFVKDAKCRSSNSARRHGIEKTIDGKKNTYWTTEEGVERVALEYNFTKRKEIDVVMLQENIRVGQRIEKFHLEAWIAGKWKKIADGTTVGYKRLLCFPTVKTSCIRISITKSRSNPTLTNVGFFKLPEELIEN
ncbi:alpha-L-fucosidase [candidate division KSB1 bacterium]|nr:alpha-L-fucosidase [candidate division KSB1 bacterium]